MISILRIYAPKEKKTVTKILNLFKKHRNVVLYLVFGALTTLVNFLVYLPLYNYLGYSTVVCNVLAWLAAVAVAFLTNKPFVFDSHDWSTAVVWKELISFLGCRIGSGVLETLILLVTVDCFRLNGNFWKLVTSVFVVILNYIFSKWIIFRKDAAKQQKRMRA